MHGFQIGYAFTAYWSVHFLEASSVVFKKSPRLKSLFATVVLIFNFNIEWTLQTQIFRRMLKSTWFNVYLPLFTCGKLGTSKSIVGTKFRRTHVCLHSQAGNRVPITGFITVSGWLFSIFISFDIFSILQWNSFAFLRYALLISVQTLTQVVKSNTTDSLSPSRIKRDNRKIGLPAIENTS